MSQVFEDARNYHFEAGSLLIGMDTDHVTGDQFPIGIKTERHAITFAGSGAGKGATVLIPNAKLWPHNLLVIDPKGEVAKATAADREAMGQSVYVVDPFMQSGVASKYLASFNPLSALDVNSLDIKEDIEIISDGIVKRDNPESSHWDDGAQAIVSGLIAYLLLTQPKERQNLIELRAIMRNVERFDSVLVEMQSLQGCAGLCESGASAGMAKEGGYFISNAEKNTRWLDSERMKNSLVETTFSMNELKRGRASVFLVLPAKQLKNHGRFLRLFIRCAISEMMNPMPDGSERGTECLFLLDEFFSLGFIEEIMVSVGLMRSMGLKLWPVLQDLGQLEKLYGREGVTTFLGNTDVHQFFGNTDPQTLDFVSARIGNFTIDDLPDAPEIDLKKTREIMGDVKSHSSPAARQGIAMAGKTELQYAQQAHNERLSRFNTEASRIIGKPRYSPDQVAKMIRKEGEGVAVGSICFAYGNRRLLLDLLPHWMMNQPNLFWDKPANPHPAPSPVQQKKLAQPSTTARKKTPSKSKAFGGISWPLFIGFWAIVLGYNLMS